MRKRNQWNVHFTWHDDVHFYFRLVASNESMMSMEYGQKWMSTHRMNVLRPWCSRTMRIDIRIEWIRYVGTFPLFAEIAHLQWSRNRLLPKYFRFSFVTIVFIALQFWPKCLHLYIHCHSVALSLTAITNQMSFAIGWIRIMSVEQKINTF